MKTTFILTIRLQGAIGYFRDVRANMSASALAQCIGDYLARGYELIAIEEIDEDIEAFYSKRLTDDDIDAMAEEAVREYYDTPIIDAMAAEMDIPE